jgi:hypothetical protein
MGTCTAASTNDTNKAVEHLLNYMFAFRVKEVIPWILMKDLCRIRPQSFGVLQHHPQSMSLLNTRLTALSQTRGDVRVHIFYGTLSEALMDPQTFLGLLLKSTFSTLTMTEHRPCKDDNSTSLNPHLLATNTHVYPPIHMLVACGTSVLKMSHYFILLCSLCRTKPQTFLQQDDDKGDCPLHFLFRRTRKQDYDRGQFVNRMNDASNVVEVLQQCPHESLSLFSQCVNLPNQRGEVPLHSMIMYISDVMQGLTEVDEALLLVAEQAITGGGHGTGSRTTIGGFRLNALAEATPCALHPPTGVYPFMLMATNSSKEFGLGATFHLLRLFVASRNLDSFNSTSE